MARPVIRIVATPKDRDRRGGPKPAVAVIYPRELNGSTMFDFAPNMESRDDSKYPKLSLVEALTSGDYFLNVYPCNGAQIVPEVDDFED